jgi:DNA-binding transcriptional regulator YiaG
MTIKEIRQSTGLSQAKFSEALGIPTRTLQKWEIGERSCPEYVVELIAYRVKHDPQFKRKGDAKA